MTSMHDENLRLQEARSVLGAFGFSTALAALPDGLGEWLLAENHLCVVAVVACKSLTDAEDREGTASAELLKMRELVDGAKRWDMYLVYLVADSLSTAEDSERRLRLIHDTRLVRRLVARGVADEDGVRRALTSLLPLPAPADSSLDDAMMVLIDQLVVNGIAPDAARLYVDAFRASGGLEVV